jgi:7-carboxy-7-deazaguanine synthase (Cx14CxxC type)
MSYSVKEIFYTLQGEGLQTGRPAVFLRFAGCNLWSGLEEDRATAVCRFCDTDFVGTGPEGGKFQTAVTLAESVAAQWPINAKGKKFVVCTGGEPLLQLDTALIAALKKHQFEIAVESNGTLPAPPGIDWLCVSPKSNAELRQLTANELKLVFPQEDAPPERFSAFQTKNFLLQPMDGPNLASNTQFAIAYCLEHPRWQLSLQTHKLIGVR